MIIVLPDMPDDLREKALTCIATLYDHILVNTDTEKEKAEFHYPSYHFSWYNRYAKHVRFHDFCPIELILMWILGIRIFS